MQTHQALCRQCDQLHGIAAALSSNAGDIAMSTAPVTNFNLPASNPGPDYEPTLTHVPSEFTIEAAMADWLEARRRLLADPLANVDDLLGPPL